MNDRVPFLPERLVAILRLDDLGGVPSLVAALLDGGIRCIELTMTHAGAPAMVEQLLHRESRFQDGSAWLGLGSVRSLSDTRRALESGAQFLVTPITITPAIELARAVRVPIAVGALSPTEVHEAWEAGASVVKVFPIRSLGPSYVRDLLGPMPEIQLMPTGGVDASSARSYLDAGAVAVGIGGNLCNMQWVRTGQWDAIRQAAKSLLDSIEAKPL